MQKTPFEMLDTTKMFYNKLYDEESKKLFEKRQGGAYMGLPVLTLPAVADGNATDLFIALSCLGFHH
jgi:hypothetical protein